MREVEVKILEIDVDKIRKKLLALGAKKIFEGKIEYKMFDFPDGSIKKRKENLRIRQIGEKVQLTHWGPKEEVKGFKIHKETQMYVENFKTGCKIFDDMGLITTAHETKTRESYQLGNIRFEIDQYPQIPAYLEIEAQKEKDVEKAVKQLGFAMKQTTDMTGGGVIRYYKNKNSGKSIDGKKKTMN